MPRKKLARRFEPRWGVTRPMLEAEAGYVSKEAQDYTRRSINELKEKMAKMAETRSHAESRLLQYLNAFSERAALQYLMARDAYHLLELYILHVSHRPHDPAAVQGSAIPPAAEKPPLVFSDSLFVAGA